MLCLVVIAASFGYLGIQQKRAYDDIKLELNLTQKALYAMEVQLEGAQYKLKFDGDPTKNDRGLFLYEDYLSLSDRDDKDCYKSRIMTFGGLDYPLVNNFEEGFTKIAENYNGYDLNTVYVFDYNK